MHSSTPSDSIGPQAVAAGRAIAPRPARESWRATFWRVYVPTLWSLAIFAVAFFSPVNYLPTDSHFSLVVSQALIEHGTPSLEPYMARIGEQLHHAGYQVALKEGRHYYVYPWGNSFLALPFVWLATGLGLDMTVPADNYLMQNLLSALTCLLMFWVLDGLGRRFVPNRDSALISGVSVTGSALLSTMATAFWSLSTAALLLAAGLLLLVPGQPRSLAWPSWPRAALLGALLFAAYACRPTAILVLPLALLYLWRQRPSAAVISATTVLLLMLPLLALYRVQLGQWLPDYYLRFPRDLLKPSVLLSGALATALLALSGYWWLVRRPRSTATTALWPLVGVGAVATVGLGLAQWLRAGGWAGDWAWEGGLGVALYGILLSPSRGLLIFSPFLLLTFAGIPILWRQLKQLPLFWLGAAWFWGYLMLLAITNSWRAGHSFGPRLLTDALPALVLLTFLQWRAIRAHRPRWRRPIARAFLALGVVAIGINSGSALFNVHTSLWNQAPDVERFPRKIFDWQCPQFLATPAALRDCQLRYLERGLSNGGVELETYPFGQTLTASAAPERVRFIGWWQRKANEQWTNSNKAYILLRLGDVSNTLYENAPHEHAPYELVLSARGFGEQTVAVAINGEPVEEVRFGDVPATHAVEVAPALWRPDAVNQITLFLPAARFPTPSEARRMGLSYSQHRLGLTDVAFAIVPKTP